ncbi:endo-beta-N-acetylglucosaminidase [Bacteroidia bacterium]|nr:endo-beta-N-acetylglucosaminidase [Bacteroidia bacterium]
MRNHIVKRRLAMALPVAIALLTLACKDDITIDRVREADYDTGHSTVYLRNDDNSRRATGIELREATFVRKVCLGLTKGVETPCRTTLSVDQTAVESYNKTNFTTYDAFPAAQVSFDNGGVVSLGKWQTLSLPMGITLEKGALAAGKYLLPIAIDREALGGGISSDREGSTLYYVITVGDPAPDNTKPYKTLCYVEVNGHNLLNTGAYTLATSGKQLMDIVVIFAANVNYNYDEQRPYLKFNENVRHILTHRDKYVKPLQDKGIKVILCVLGNHDFTGVASLGGDVATEFALECRNAIEAYGLDGIDLDDEWSSYNSSSPVGGASGKKMGELVLALRKAMPDKLLTVFNWGLSSSIPTTVNGEAVADAVDLAMQGSYGSYSSYTPYGLPKSRYCPLAVWVNPSNRTPSTSTLAYYSQSIINDGCGGIFFYDLTKDDASAYFSYASNVLFGEATVVSGPLYDKDF